MVPLMLFCVFDLSSLGAEEREGELVCALVRLGPSVRSNSDCTVQVRWGGWMWLVERSIAHIICNACVFEYGVSVELSVCMWRLSLTKITSMSSVSPSSSSIPSKVN